MAVSPATDTVTAVACARGAWSNVPVTVISRSLTSSATDAGSTLSVTVADAVSSSSTLTSTGSALSLA